MAVRRIAAGTLAVLALPALLAGCGGDSSVADPPVASSPSSPTSSAPPAHETAEHFIRRWAEAEKHMENTGQTRAYSSLTYGCHACDSLARDVKRFYRNGGYIHWNGLRVISVNISAKQPSGATVFAVRTDSTPTRYRESASSSEKTLAGGITRELVTLKPSDSSWLVTARARVAG